MKKYLAALFLAIGCSVVMGGIIQNSYDTNRDDQVDARVKTLVGGAGAGSILTNNNVSGTSQTLTNSSGSILDILNTNGGFTKFKANGDFKQENSSITNTISLTNNSLNLAVSGVTGVNNLNLRTNGVLSLNGAQILNSSGGNVTNVFTVGEVASNFSAIGSSTISAGGLFSGTYSNTYVKIRDTLGTLTVPVWWNSTNEVFDNTHHITLANGQCRMTSSDGAFAGLQRIYQIECGTTTPQQLIISRWYDNNNVDVESVGPGYYSTPIGGFTNVTGFFIRPPMWRWTDDSVGGENFGGVMDDNGMFWLAGVGDQGTYSMINFENGTMVNMAMGKPQDVGLGNDGSSEILGFSGASTNDPTGTPAPVFYAFFHSKTPSETFGTLSNGLLAIGCGAQGDGVRLAGWTNRHGLWLSSYVGMKDGRNTNWILSDYPTNAAITANSQHDVTTYSAYTVTSSGVSNIWINGGGNWDNLVPGSVINVTGNGSFVFLFSLRHTNAVVGDGIFSPFTGQTIGYVEMPPNNFVSFNGNQSVATGSRGESIVKGGNGNPFNVIWDNQDYPNGAWKWTMNVNNSAELALINIFKNTQIFTINGDAASQCIRLTSDGPKVQNGNNLRLEGGAIFTPSVTITNTISVPTNTASVTKITNPLSLGSAFTTPSARTDYTLQYVANDSAVSGSPFLVFSNFTTGEAWTNGNTFVLSGTEIKTWRSPLCSPSDVVGAYDKSTGSASITLVGSLATKQ